MFKINIFVLHFYVSRSGAHDICDTRLGNSTSRLGTLKINYFPIRIQTSSKSHTDFECLKYFGWLEFSGAFKNDLGLKFDISSVVLCFPKLKRNLLLTAIFFFSDFILSMFNVLCLFPKAIFYIFIRNK